MPSSDVGHMDRHKFRMPPRSTIHSQCRDRRGSLQEDGTEASVRPCPESSYDKRRQAAHLHTSTVKIEKSAPREEAVGHTPKESAKQCTHLCRRLLCAVLSACNNQEHNSKVM